MPTQEHSGDIWKIWTTSVETMRSSCAKFTMRMAHRAMSDDSTRLLRHMSELNMVVDFDAMMIKLDETLGTDRMSVPVIDLFLVHAPV